MCDIALLYLGLQLLIDFATFVGRDGIFCFCLFYLNKGKQFSNDLKQRKAANPHSGAALTFCILSDKLLEIINRSVKVSCEEHGSVLLGSHSIPLHASKVCFCLV